MKLFFATLVSLVVVTSYAQVKPKPKPTTTPAKVAAPKTKESKVLLETPYGNMVIVLYDSTPLHKANFMKLVSEKFYDGLLFHRVIEGFMIQGGDPTSKNADSSAMLGGGSAPGERIPAEFKTFYTHKKGALAAARDNNPQMASSNCQFYIVQGKPYTDVEINMMECRARQTNAAFTYTDAQRKIFKTQGGTPFLDQSYTVFGEVISGLEVIDKIAKLPKAANDRPATNVTMKMTILP